MPIHKSGGIDFDDVNARMAPDNRRPGDYRTGFRGTKPLSIRSVTTKLSSHLMLSSPADRGITHAVFSSFNVAG